MHYNTSLMRVSNNIFGHHRAVHVITHVEVERL